MLDPVSLLVGFVFGTVAAAFAFHLGFMPKGRRALSEVTTVWDLASIAAEPRLVLERVDGVQPPPGSKILLPQGTARVPQQVLATCDVRTHPGVHENAALGSSRALVFTTIARPGALAIATRDPAVLNRLESEWSRTWKEAEPFAPTVPLSAVGAIEGGLVEVRGVSAGMTEYRGRNVLRLEADGHALPVLVDADPGLGRRPMRVLGRVVKDHGLTYLAAERIVPLDARTA